MYYQRIEMMIFKINAILEINQTIVSDENLKSRNSNADVEIYLNWE